MTDSVRTGLAAAFSAYFLWGLLPLYFTLLRAYPPEVILAHRVFWSVPTGIALILVSRRVPQFLRSLKPPTVLWLTLSGLTIGANWLVYIWAIGQNRVVEASLGYYINPLVNVAIGAMFFSEKLRPLQWAAFGLAALGVLGEAVTLGHPPYVALFLCLTFASYGVIRKKLAVEARVGFLVEVLVLLPALAIWAASSGMASALIPLKALDWPLLMISGAVTATPLIFFSVAARRLRLSTIGFIQYLAPTLQFLIGVMLGEELTTTRLFAFSLIWIALAVYSTDSILHEMRVRRPPAMAKAVAKP